MATWIDFKELRRQLRFADLLRHYKVELKIKGDRATGLCPLPTHPQRSDGRRTPSFSAHLSKGIWRCFGCGQSGNLAEFGSRMEGCDPDDPVQFRQAALKLAEIFNLTFSRPTARAPVEIGDGCGPKAEGRKETTAPSKAVVVNAPIDFELKKLDTSHPYLLARGFTSQTISHFGIGFCSRGLMKDRIAIPVHDSLGGLVAYAGRLVDDSKVDDQHPRYLFPAPRERDGVVHEFRKSEIVFNLHRLEDGLKDIIVVEGFMSVFWLHQHHLTHAVSLMGSSCSSQQASLIDSKLSRDGRIWLMPDGDGAGEQLAGQALPLLAQYRFSRLVRLGANQQPTDKSGTELCQLSGG